MPPVVVLRPLACILLHDAPPSGVIDERGSVFKQFIQSVPKIPRFAVRNNLLLPSLVDDGGRAACGHRFDGRHAEVLGALRVVVFVDSKTRSMPEDPGLAVRAPEFFVRTVDMKVDGMTRGGRAQLIEVPLRQGICPAAAHKVIRP